MNPYRSYVARLAQLIAEGQALPLGALPPRPKPEIPPHAPVGLVFSPHPDDECVVGALPLRLLRQNSMRLVNIAVTLGSRPERRAPRHEELKNACHYIGFELELLAPDGLEKIHPAARTDDPAHWNRCVQIIAGLLARRRPRLIFFPHQADWHPTHIGTHFLVMDALKAQPAEFETLLIETEFWRPMAAPNLMVELSLDDAADLLAALSFHVGEVRRNPYHLRLPAWWLDNVRRGAELVGGPGAVAPDFLFATLYRARRWRNKQVQECFTGGQSIGASDSPAAAFGWSAD